MPKPRTLKVWPNPFSSHDPEGRANGVVSLEPIGDGLTVFDDRRFVGATLKAKITKKAPPGSAQQHEQDTWFEYGDEPSTVMLTPYYVRAIRNGELFCADETSAKLAGVKFLDPAISLKAARDGVVNHIEKMLAHEAHDTDFTESLKKFEFGPMLAKKPPSEEEPKKLDDKVSHKVTKGGV